MLGSREQNISRTLALFCALLVFEPANPAPAVPSQAPTPATPAAEEIIRRLIEENQRRDRLLAGYQVVRRYRLKNELYEKQVLLEADANFTAPSNLTFTVRRQEGSSFLAREVFGRIMDGEKNLAQPENKRRSAMTPENYEFRLEGADTVRGRPAYRLEIIPRQEDKLLFRGKIWVDARDFAVVRAEGSPVKRPNFWTRKVVFTRTFKKVGPFWLPERTDSTNDILLFGTTSVSIENGDYRVRLNPAPR